MGTSQSTPGLNGNSPLIPSWADEVSESPNEQPQPENRRFAGFKQSLGQSIKNNSSTDLRKALGHYAKKSTGGSATAVRRMGAVTRSGTQLFSLLSNGSISIEGRRFNLSELNGLPYEDAIDQIVNFLATLDGDSEKIRIAMIEALSLALEDMEEFNSELINDDLLKLVMINYLTEAIFNQVLMDAGDAFNKADTYLQAIKAQNALHELVKVIVDKNMTEKFGNSIQIIDENQMLTIQRETIREVFIEWESYE